MKTGYPLFTLLFFLSSFSFFAQSQTDALSSAISDVMPVATVDVNTAPLDVVTDPEQASLLAPCDVFTNITCGYSQTHTTVGAGNDFVLANYPGLPTTSAFDGPDLLFRLQITTKTNVHIVMNINTVGEDLDMMLLTNCTSPVLKSYTGEPNAVNGIYKEIIDVNLDPGFYYLVVDGYNTSQAGSFTLSVDCTSTGVEPPGELSNAYKYFADDFENYTGGGPVDNQSNRWRKWNTSSTNGAIVLQETLNKFARFNYASPAPDLIYQLSEGNAPAFDQPITSGRWRLSWSMNVGLGKTGYFNILHKKPDNSGNNPVWAYEVFFNRNNPNQGELELANSNTVVKTFYIPSDFNFNVVNVIDLAKDSVELWINNVFVHAWKFSISSNGTATNQLDGINFYAGRVSTDDFRVDALTVYQKNASLNCSSQTLGDLVCLGNGKKFNGPTIAWCNLYSSLEYDFCESICDYGGTFVRRGQYISGTFDYSDRAPGQLREMQCVKDAYGQNVPQDLYSDIYIFYHDDPPNNAFLDWASNTSPNTKAFLMKCSAFIPAPHFERPEERLTPGDTCIYFANCLNQVFPGATNFIYYPGYEHNKCDNFYYIVITGTLGESYGNMQITPGNACPDNISELACGTQFEFGITSFAPLISDQYYSNVWFDNAYPCYNGDRSYTGGEAFYKIVLNEPKRILVTLNATEAMGMFLFSFLCGKDCIQYAGTLPNGTAVLTATLAAGTYYLVIDKDFPGGDESFFISMDCTPTTLLGPDIFTVRDFEESPDCPVDGNNRHQVTIPNQSSGYVRFDQSDYVQFLYPTNFGGVKTSEEQTTKWTNSINQPQSFQAYADQFGGPECGFTTDETIYIRQIQDDNAGSRRLRDFVIEYAPVGGGNNATDKFKTNGYSTVSRLVPKPAVTFGMSSNEKLMNRVAGDTSLVEFSSNLPWAVSFVDYFPTGTGGWLELNKYSSYSGVTTITFKTLQANNSYQPRSALLKFYAIGYENNYFQYVRVVQAGICSSIQGLTVTTNMPGNSICRGDSITLTATASGGGTLYHYYWENTGEEKRIIKVAPQTSGSFTVYVTNPNYCDANDLRSVFITVKNPLTVTTTGGSISCQNNSVTLTATTAATSPSYSWQGPGGFTSNQQNPVVFLTGTYTVTVTSPSACSGTATAVVSGNNTAPQITTSTSGQLNCTNSSVTISASATTNPRYNWTGPGGFTSDQPSNVVSLPGNYIVTVTNQNNGCTATALVTVIQNITLPTVTTSVSGLLLCTGAPVQLFATANPSNSSYMWTGPSNYSSNTQNPMVSNGGTYTVKVTNLSNGCTATATALVQTDTNVPNATASGGTLTCANPQIQLTGNSSSNGVNYQWTGPNNFNVTNQPVVSVGVPGTYTFKVTFNATGCSSSVAVTVDEDKAPPGASATGGTVNCANPDLTLQGSTSNPAGVTWSWTGPGNFSSPLQNPQTGAGGTYVLTVTKTSNGCSSTAQALVQEDKTPPVAGIDAPDTLKCQQTTVQLDATPSSQGAAFSYAWTTSNGNILNGSNTLTPTVNQTGSYTLVVTNTGNGCTASATVIVPGVQNLPQADAGASAALTCLAQETTLHGTGSSGGLFSYLWTGPGIVSGATTLNPVVNLAGVYTLTVENTQTHCTNADTVSVASNTTPPDLGAPLTAVIPCTGNGTVQLTATSVTPGLQYQWFGPGNNLISSAATVTVGQAGVYTVVALSPLTGCSSTRQVTVSNDNQAPTGGAGPDTTICIGDSWTLGQGNDPAYLYQWSPQTALTNPAAASPVTTPSANQIYFVTITNPANQCTITDQVQITVSQNLYVYFTVTQEIKCHGDATGAILVTGVGGISPFDYVWSNGSTSTQLNNLTANIYTVTVTDQAGCSRVQPVGLSEPTAITADFTVSQPSGGNPNSGFIIVSPSGGTPAYQFQWLLNNTPVPNETNPGITGLSNLQGYTVRITDANGCVKVFDPFSTPTVEPGWAQTGIRLFPNPTSGQVQVLFDLPEGFHDIAVRCYDMMGREILSRNGSVPQRDRWRFDLSDQPNGLYLLKFNVEDAPPVVRKVSVVR